MKDKLDWKPWTGPDDIPENVWCLFKIDHNFNKYQTGIFGKSVGTIGGRFYFDWTILEWAVIEDIV